MGKGSRNRQMRITDNEVTSNPEAKLSKKQLVKREEKRAKIKKFVAVTACLVIIVAVVAAIFIGSYRKKNVLNGVICGTSEKYEVNNGMVAYYMYSQLRNMQNSYSQYGQDMDFSGDEYKQYFMSYSKAMLQQYVALATEAQEKGYKLEKSDKTAIDDEIDAIGEAAKTNGYPSTDAYLAAFCCEGVNTKTVRQCMEIEVLANKYYGDMTGKYKVEDSDLDAYLEEHPGDFRKVDYIEYSFDGVPEDATSEEKAKALEERIAKAEALLENVTDEQGLRDAINEIEREKAKDDSNSETKLTDDEKAEIDATDYSTKYMKVGYAYDEEKDFTKWAFDAERKVGDYQISKGDLGCTVQYIIKTDYIIDYPLRNVRYILLGGPQVNENLSDEKKAELNAVRDEAKKAADEVLAKYNSGAKTAEAFGELAKQYSADSSSSSNGGLYEGVYQGQTVSEFNDWVFDKARSKGDVEIIDSKDYGYFVVYYVGENDEVQWKVEAKDAILTQKAEDDISALETKHPLKFDDTKLAKIPYNV